jgi:hypothetical protein
MSDDLIQLLHQSHLERPVFMTNDLLMSEMTWGDLERVWGKVSSPANRHLVADLVTAMWAESAHLHETHTFHRVLAATIILAGPAYGHGSGEGPATQT